MEYCQCTVEPSSLNNKELFLAEMEALFDENNDVTLPWGSGVKCNRLFLHYDHDLDQVFVGSCRALEVKTMVCTNLGFIKEFIAKYEKEIKEYYFEV